MHKCRAALPILCASTCLLWSEPPAASSLNLRLTTTLTSYDSKVGSEFRAVVIAPYELNGELVLPSGTVVLGSVRRVKGIGLGIVRERASLDLTFREYELADGRRFPFRAMLRTVDNAREKVNEEGRITGILAANGPQNLVGGVWHRPSIALLTRAFIGLTGAGGRIFSAYSMGPIGGTVLFAIRCAMFRLPEPEIRFPVGTEMKLTVTELPAGSPAFASQEPAIVPTDLAEWLAKQPVEVSKPRDKPAPDLINIAILGSREDLENAFRAAGWFEAESLTPRSFSRAYTAFTKQTGYAAAPMSKLLYHGDEPDAVFQKSFNTMRKRDHIRLWRAEAAGEELWLGAATHDIGVKFKTALTLTHRIHPQIDAERAKVVNDLTFAGCVEPAGYVDRAASIRTGVEAKEVITDGKLAVLFLRSACRGPLDTFSPDMPNPPNSRAGRIVRRMMLEGRQYALRGNAYYWAWRAIAFHRSRKEPWIEE